MLIHKQIDNNIICYNEILSLPEIYDKNKFKEDGGIEGAILKKSYWNMMDDNDNPVDINLYLTKKIYFDKTLYYNNTKFENKNGFTLNDILKIIQKEQIENFPTDMFYSVEDNGVFVTMIDIDIDDTNHMTIECCV